MKTLKSAIAVRVLDSIGVVTKEMNDVRIDAYLIKHKDEKIYSGRVGYSDNESLVFLYMEAHDGVKYMTVHFEDETQNEGNIIFCIVTSVCI